MTNLTYDMKLAKAKAQLVLDHPFFASLLLSMPMLVDESVKTASVNGEEIRFNPAFIDSLTLPETVFLLAHETMHCVFQHMHRRGDKDHGVWNQAGDYVINGTLVDEKIGVMPQGGLLNPQLVTDGDGTTEGVYKILYGKPPPEPDGDGEEPNGGQDNGAGDGKGQPGPGDPGGPLDDVQDAASDDATNSQKEAEMRVKIVQAANAAKMCGKLSAGMERIVKQFTKSHVDWRAVLRRFLSERAKTDLSYARPKRRFLADDINLPSLVGEKLGSIVIAVDCSGSIDDDVIALFGAECAGIKEDVKPSNVHVVYFDTKILRHDTFDADTTLEVNAVGGGGTAFSPIFEYVDEKGLDPVAVVVLTDLDCDDFGNPPSCPVLWASIRERETVPFGEIVLVKER